MSFRAFFSAVLLVYGAPGSGSAQPLADPTRPPMLIAAPESQSSASAPGQRLQSTLLSSGRRLAVIDGNAVPVGGKVGDAVVVSITDSTVVLRHGEGTETLTLHPSVRKTTKAVAGGRP